MKKFVLTKYLMLFVALIIISACSDSNSPSSTTNYFPMTTGTWWVYDVTSTDVNNLPINSIDSTVVIGTETKEGLTASILKTFTNGQNPSTQDFYADATKLQTLISSLLPDAGSVGIPIPITTGWATIADNNNATWTIATIPITDVPITIPTFGEVKLNGNVVISGKKGSTSSVTGAGQTWTAQEYIVSFTVNVNASIIPISFSVNTHYFYADKVGLVKTVIDEATVPVVNQKIAGSTSIIKKYNIATK